MVLPLLHLRPLQRGPQRQETHVSGSEILTDKLKRSLLNVRDFFYIFYSMLPISFK
jgi:hypothetical protein